MELSQLSNLLVDQSKNLIWMIDPDFNLVYANKSYLNLMKEMTGVEKKLNEPILVEGFGEGYIEKWTAYYQRALKGECFEIEEHYYRLESNEIQFGQITFTPLAGDEGKIVAVSCESRNITRLVKERSEANQLMDASLDVFCVVNEKNNFVYVNSASFDHWGYKPEELIGKSVRELILEEDLSETTQIIDSVLSGQTIKSFNNRYKRKDGGIAYNLWSTRYDNDSKLRYGVARDGKEKLEQEEIILKSEQRFKALVQEGSDLIGILDAEGNYVYVSPTSISVLGMKPEEFIGKNVFDFIHPDDIERTLACLQKIVTENRVLVEPFRFQNQQKEWRWMETVLTNMLDNPVVKGIVANSRDITDKIEEQHQLKLLESVITNTKDSVLITEAEPFDEPGPRIIYVNEAFTKMTGYSAEEVIGKSPRMLQGPNSNKEELSNLGKALKNWEPYEITTINYKKSGEEFWVNFTVTPVADDKGWFTHWIAIERDVTEQKIKELEKELIAQISINFSSENDLIKASKTLCETVGKFGKFDWVELWTSNIEKTQILLSSHYVAAVDDEKFYDYNPDFNSLKIAEDLAGEVWQKGEQLLWDNIENHQHFLRKDAAKKIGLKTVLGIPLIFNEEVVGVLKIGAKINANHLKNYTRIFQQLEGFIGSELNRKKLENNLSHLFDSIPDILCLGDFNGRFLRINKAGCELLGYSEDEILHHSIEEFVHPDDKDISVNELLRLRQGETTFQFENRYLTKSGDIIWLSWYCTSAIEEGLIYATAKNITEEKKLRELNRQVGSLAKIGSWEFDVVNQSHYWSDEVHNILNTDPKSFEPNLEKDINFYREDFRQLAKLSFEKCLAKGEPFDFEAVIVTDKKKELWIRAIGNAEIADGVCKRIYGSLQDISSLKETENRLQSLSENLPGIVFQYIIHQDGTDSVRYLSGSVAQLWGFTANEVEKDLNIVWEQVRAAGDYEKVKSSIIKAVQTKSNWSSRFKYVMPTGELKTHLGNGTPTFLADGNILFNSIVLDITQEAKNEVLLKQASAMARIGSWELDLIKQDDQMYWSTVVKEIFEVNVNYNPRLEDSLAFYIGESRNKKQHAMNLLIKEGIEFDDEYLIRTDKGKERWIRCIGKSEMANNRRTKIFGSFQDIHERKVAEEKIRIAFEEKTNILESIGDGFFAIDNKGIVTYWNKQAELILGRKKEELLGKPLWDVYGYLADTQFFSQFLKIIKTREIVHFEEYAPRLNIWLEVSAYPSVEGISVYLKDITLRKEAEANLQIANERFEKVTEATNDAIWDWDLENQTIYRSKAFEKFFGKQNLKSLDLTNLWEKQFHPEDQVKCQSQIYECIANPLISNWETKYRIYNEFGEILHVIDRGLIIRNKEGKAVRMVGVMTDVTEQKKSAEENRFKANLLSTIGQAAIATNLDGVVNFWNNAAEAIYGWKAEEAIGKNIMELTTPETNIEQANQIMEVLKKGQTWTGQFNVRKKDGTGFAAQITNSPTYDEHNLLSGIIGISSDITEDVKNAELLKRYNLELKRSNEELEQFAFVASHDLQEPLRMISSFMDLLQRKYGTQLDQKGLQYIHFATDGAKRMKQIILDLLEFSKSNKNTDGIETVDINEILSEFKNLRRKLISEKKASIISSNLPTLNSYKAAVTQIVHCLLDNAIKYSKEDVPPIIEIIALEHESQWEFAIKDNGIGIDTKFYDKIFIIFQRLHNKDQYSGTGIGLSIAKRHVEFLGGKIWLESKVGVGTTFYFTISKIETHE
jgi:PAS domain S-box-containing protein